MNELQNLVDHYDSWIEMANTFDAKGDARSYHEAMKVVRLIRSQILDGLE